MSGGGLTARPTTSSQQSPFAGECGLVILHSSLILILASTAKTAFKSFDGLGLRGFILCRTFLGSFGGLKWAI